MSGEMSRRDKGVWVSVGKGGFAIGKDGEGNCNAEFLVILNVRRARPVCHTLVAAENITDKGTTFVPSSFLMKN